MTLSRTRPDEQERRWLALFQGIIALSNTLDPQRVLETALDASTALVQDQEGPLVGLVMAALLYPENPARPRTLKAGAMRGLPPEERRVELPGAAGLIGQAFQEGKPQLSNQVGEDPELSRFASLRACKEVFCIPFGRSGLDGVLLYGHQQAGFFSTERRQFLELLARQSSLALNNARRFQETRLKIENILDLQERNRQETARELHDGPTQSVAALAMRVNFARRIAFREDPGLVEELEKIEAVARQATSELRQLQFKIHPHLLESRGLVPALQELGERTSQVHGLGVEVQVDPEVLAGLEMARQAAVFKLVDQVLRVTCRKEELENIRVKLGAKSQGQILLEIEDDGLAVAESDWDSTGTAAAWLDGIREQVDLLGGVLEVKGAGGHTTCLRIAFAPDEA